ncbi:phage tail terminator protein [Zavarzinia aquatilis]|uniref:DUF3168 domain-containing protein n=1 Tax=Zavarzinia aquatilis TaxID=2211142 RepID=A0A317DUV8_9PROT|nr:hypothetical protein [Zavarzinia aquatilis]PWR17636.1 hypothetical protein DKG74_20725 [Zavarzinia aquatilis]
MIDPVIARLKATAMPPLRLIEGMAELASLAGKQPRAMPAAYVVPLDERAEPAATTLRVRQRVTVTFGVIVIARNVSDLGRGGASLADLAPVREAVRAALLGWGEGDGVTDSPITFAGGQVLDADAGLVAWQDSFTTALYYQQS